jgi:hypothetical protein
VDDGCRLGATFSVFVRQVQIMEYLPYLTYSSSPPNFKTAACSSSFGVWVCLFMGPICTHHETGDEVVRPFIS